MEFLAKVAASLLTGLAAFAANLMPSPAIPVAAAAKVDQPAVVAPLHVSEPSAIKPDRHKLVHIEVHGDAAQIKLLIASSKASVEGESIDLSALLDAAWSLKSSATAALPWYVDQRQQKDCSAFPSQLFGDQRLTR